MNPHPGTLRHWLITFAAVFAAGTGGILLPRFGAQVPLPLLPSGIAVAAYFRWGRGMWPAVFVAAICTDLWIVKTPIQALSVTAGATASAALTAWILEWRGFDANFSRARDVPLFIFAAALGMAVTPTAGLLGRLLAGQGMFADPLRWVLWWSNDTVGVMLVGPMLVAVSRRSFAQFAQHWAAGALWLMSLAIFCVAVFTLGSASVGRPLVGVLSMLLIVIGAIRFGLVVTAFGALIMSTTVAFSFVFGRGVYGQFDELTGLAMVWSVSAVGAILNLTIIALLAERDSAGQERLRAERRYAQVFDGSPQPLWVHDRNTDEFLLVNEAT
ncbi:MAG: MASE1 domain-containing protein, partial [Pseudomonadota bacterium]|nr:MASE1 domain-containing protein [Pseudomonadota bacterium]